MAGRKRKFPDSFVPDPLLSEDEDGNWVESDHLRYVPPVPMHMLRHAPGQQLQEQQQQQTVDQQQGQANDQPHDDELQLVEGEQVQDNDQQLVADDQPHDELQLVDEEQVQNNEVQLVGDEEVLDNDLQLAGDEQVQDELQVDDDDIQDLFLQLLQGDNAVEQEIELETDDADDDDLPDEGEEEEEDQQEHIENLSYQEIYSKLTEQWLSAELDHRVSKSASNCFWKLSNTYFPALYEAKKREGRKRKVVQFKQIRKTLYDTRVPKVSLQIIYKHNQSGEIFVENGVSTPASRYPPNVYRKIYEVASVEVIIQKLFCLSSVSPSVVRPSVRQSFCVSVRAYVHC